MSLQEHHVAESTQKEDQSKAFKNSCLDNSRIGPGIRFDSSMARGKNLYLKNASPRMKDIGLVRHCFWSMII